MKELEGYTDKNNFVYDVEYEVSINLKPNWDKKTITAFIKENLQGIEIIDIKNKIVKLLWPLEIFSGEEEIIMEMYELLNQGELGTYSYERIK